MANNLKKLIEWAWQTDYPPTYMSSSDVLVTGKALSKPIHWIGRQWAVTTQGVEARDGTYVVEKKRLWQDEETHGLIEHMAEKEWVDLPDFCEAVRLARRLGEPPKRLIVRASPPAQRATPRSVLMRDPTISTPKRAPTPAGPAHQTSTEFVGMTSGRVTRQHKAGSL